MKKIMMRLRTVATDPVQYKPYSPVLEEVAGKEVYVALDVDDKNVIGETEDGHVIISIGGVVGICSNIATTIDDMNFARQKTVLENYNKRR